MIDKFCVIIDDEPQTEIIEDLIHQAKAQHFNLECVQLNPQDDTFSVNIGSVTPHIVIDITKVVEELNTPTYLRRKVDIIACDYNLQDEHVNGFEIIRALRNQLGYRKDVILYSGNLDDVIGKILGEETETKKRIQKIHHLTNANIARIVNREEYQAPIIEVLRKERFSLRSELESALYKSGDWKFRSIFPPFIGKTLAEIADEISRDTTKGIEFQKAIIESAMAHMIDLNKEING